MPGMPENSREGIRSENSCSLELGKPIGKQVLIISNLRILAASNFLSKTVVSFPFQHFGLFAALSSLLHLTAMLCMQQGNLSDKGLCLSHSLLPCLVCSYRKSESMAMKIFACALFFFALTTQVSGEKGYHCKTYEDIGDEKVFDYGKCEVQLIYSKFGYATAGCPTCVSLTSMIISCRKLTPSLGGAPRETHKLSTLITGLRPGTAPLLNTTRWWSNSEIGRHNFLSSRFAETVIFPVRSRNPFILRSIKNPSTRNPKSPVAPWMR